MKIPKELIKEYVKSENFTNTTDIIVIRQLEIMHDERLA